MIKFTDVQGLPGHLLSCGQTASGIWTPKYCLLFQQKLLLFGPQAVSKKYFKIYKNRVARVWHMRYQCPGFQGPQSLVMYRF